eukprot:COSAG06_NODE_6182_length_3061_cov_29.177920_2_plen_109_part_00
MFDRILNVEMITLPRQARDSKHRESTQKRINTRLHAGHSLEIRHVKALHEAGGALLVGVAGGALLRWSGGEGTGPLAVTHAAVLGVARFDERFFFFVLLPPIILEVCV